MNRFFQRPYGRTASSPKRGKSVLNEQNFRRISWINILLAPPLFILFSWPYFFFALWYDFPEIVLYAGTFCFSFPFTLTIIHGHVTVALGALHRGIYHDWLKKHHWGFGFFLRPLLFSTRFRFILLFLSFAAFGAGILL